MEASELITFPKGTAHKTGKPYKGVKEIPGNMRKKAGRKIKSVPEKSSKKMIKIEDSIEQYIAEYEFFDADNLNLHAPPLAIEEVEMVIVK